MCRSSIKHFKHFSALLPGSNGVDRNMYTNIIYRIQGGGEEGRGLPAPGEGGLDIAGVST
jgi:hypothetical protein